MYIHTHTYVHIGRMPFPAVLPRTRPILLYYTMSYYIVLFNIIVYSFPGCAPEE